MDTEFSQNLRDAFSRFVLERSPKYGLRLTTKVNFQMFPFKMSPLGPHYNCKVNQDHQSDL